MLVYSRRSGKSSPRNFTNISSGSRVALVLRRANLPRHARSPCCEFILAPSNQVIAGRYSKASQTFPSSATKTHPNLAGWGFEETSYLEGRYKKQEKPRRFRHCIWLTRSFEARGTWLPSIQTGGGESLVK
jgi:hypothetical protein